MIENIYFTIENDYDTIENHRKNIDNDKWYNWSPTYKDSLHKQSLSGKEREVARNYSNCLSAVFKCYLVLFVNLSCLNFKFI